MSTYQLAQLNIATLLAPLDSPQLAGFVDALDRINALAEATPGFVWRLKDEGGDATAIRHFGDDVIVNMSVWKGIDALHDYVYRSDHAQIFKRRREWFARMADAYMVLWWVPAGHVPTLAEAAGKLALLQRLGPTPDAFTFRDPCPPPDAVGTQTAADALP
ncbi:DUF3291 domain-containing protein [Jeongeupia chitinilytica]|uniref:DUF3291 domain-containing protein n=1 Tax=Jeongeupia chitinilytica TaxID=1041641 RepID=UPI001673D76B|nr:DUF3291 domain-containing protein [Jeongeupia chitinilytica]